MHMQDYITKIFLRVHYTIEHYYNVHYMIEH